MDSNLKFGDYVPYSIFQRIPSLLIGSDSFEKGYHYKFKTKSGKYELSVLCGSYEAFGWYSNGVDTYEIALIDPNKEIIADKNSNDWTDRFVWDDNVLGNATAADILKILEEN